MIASLRSQWVVRKAYLPSFCKQKLAHYRLLRYARNCEIFVQKIVAIYNSSIFILWIIDDFSISPCCKIGFILAMRFHYNNLWMIVFLLTILSLLNKRYFLFCRLLHLFVFFYNCVFSCKLKMSIKKLIRFWKNFSFSYGIISLFSIIRF